MAATMISQELFDETLLENEECFELSPSEALRETIHQFCRQLGHDNNGDVDSDDEEPNLPTAMTHLTLTHPSTAIGQSERTSRTAFRNYLSLLDSCVGSDGTVVINTAVASLLSDESTGNGENGDDSSKDSVDAILNALTQLATKMRSSPPCNNTRCNDDALPYLLVFQQSSSIYTLMSFLTNNIAIASPSQQQMNKLQIINGAVSALSTILSSTLTTAPQSSIRGELRDTFVSALNKVVQLLFQLFIFSTSSTTTDKATTTLQKQTLQNLLQLCIHATKGCERGKVAFVQSSVIVDHYNNNSGGVGSSYSRKEQPKGGGVFVLYKILSYYADKMMNDSSSRSSSNINNDHTIKFSNDNDDDDDDGTTMVNNMRTIDVVCQLIVTLCRYDDFRPTTKTASFAPTTSSAHDHAMEFHRGNMTHLLMKIVKWIILNDDDNVVVNDDDDVNDDDIDRSFLLLTKEGKKKKIKEQLTISVLMALRVLAVNDEIIQTMVALGVLPVVTKALQLSVVVVDIDTTATTTATTISTTIDDEDGGGNSSSSPNEEKRRSSSHHLNLRKNHPRLAAGSLGLLRNLCGNDEIKTNLCLGSSSSTGASSSSSSSFTPSALPHLLHIMELYPTISSIQEHACGTLAAMALRRPMNARVILESDGVRWIILAMKRHEENVGVLRQGALAIRNIVSRLMKDLDNGGGGGNSSNDTNDDVRNDIRDRFRELGVEDVLRNIAGRHQGSVDEAYAALRDLGHSVTLTKINTEDLLSLPEEGGGQRQNYHGNNLVGSSRTMMFGEKHNSNFRPVYEESAGLNSAVDEAILKFGV